MEPRQGDHRRAAKKLLALDLVDKNYVDAIAEALKDLFPVPPKYVDDETLALFELMRTWQRLGVHGFDARRRILAYLAERLLGASWARVLRHPDERS